jgi:hypothetical protein
LNVGLLQFPAFVMFKSFLGTSTAYSVLTAQYMHLASEGHRKAFTYVDAFLKLKAWWQIPHVLGAMGGGYFSSNAITTPHVARSVGPLCGFIGGFVVVYGARYSGGCATGHGISGLAL